MTTSGGRVWTGALVAPGFVRRGRQTHSAYHEDEDPHAENESGEHDEKGRQDGDCEFVDVAWSASGLGEGLCAVRPAPAIAGGPGCSRGAFVA